jgi:diphthine synthase
VLQAIEQLLEVEEVRKEGAYDGNTMCVGISRLQADDQQIVAGAMKDLLVFDFGAPLHCLIIGGDVHIVEEEILAFYKVT